jgi:uncharacterized protein YcaQ
MADDVLDLSADEARRIVLEAQGFSDARPRGEPRERHVHAVLDRIRLLQIDSVNVLVRAHYLPLFSRLGPYDRTMVDRLAYEKRELFEFWGHAATLLPARFQPLLRWRMERKAWPDLERLHREKPGFVDSVLAEITTRGPLAASELTDAGARAGAWWGWGDGKHVLEWLFATGRVTTATRRNFERIYDLTERVLPADLLSAPTPAPDDAKKALLVESAHALGVATARELADYFRIHGPTARTLVAELAEAGALRRVRVQGWAHPAFAPPGLRVPRRAASARALISPFDPLVFERARAQRIFDFSYRIEIYTPEAKRVYGYYVLPFLFDGDLAARVDLKADRATGRLLVHAAHLEPGRHAPRVADALAHELREVARWLDLSRVVVARKGNLAPRLRAALAAAPDGPPRAQAAPRRPQLTPPKRRPLAHGRAKPAQGRPG